MTDEERAREYASDYSFDAEHAAHLFSGFTTFAAAVRADEREKCAQVVEQPFQRCAVSSDVVVPPYVASSIASAIRAMGDKP